VALSLGNLLTTYITPLFTTKISTIWIKIVEVAHRGLAARGRMIWLRIGFWIFMLGVEIENSLNFLRVFFSTFRGYRYSRRY
jgi:hypothetical protein